MTSAEAELIRVALDTVRNLDGSEYLTDLQAAASAVQRERASPEAIAEYRESLRIQKEAIKAHSAVSVRLALPASVIADIYRELES